MAGTMLRRQPGPVSRCATSESVGLLSFAEQGFAKSKIWQIVQAGRYRNLVPTFGRPKANSKSVALVDGGVRVLA